MLLGSVNHRSQPSEKISLFRSLFRGRDDVYPRRFESRATGKTGYSPVCSNEWVSGICEKPRVKCAVCQHRSFLPVTDDVIRRHLIGTDERGNDFIAGVYPMLLDETCFFLAIDLDKANWQDDAIAVLETCRRFDVPAALERSRSGNGGHIHDLYRELIFDRDRNHMICEDVVQSIRDGRSPLVLTERKDHLDELAANLEKHIRHVVVLKGGTGIKESRAIAQRLSAIKPGEDRVLLATGRYIGEGFDDPRLDTLFLTLPVSWRGTIAQYVGRLHRLHEGKTEVRVYDYADLNVPMLSHMFDRRCSGYEAVGYTVLLPGSAVPGWPSDIPLPVDPQWKTEYAATVRRLVRDGVDAPLATLFVHVARKFDSDAQGVERARSASEAFLFRRLESLPETAGRFALNAELPIPFDGWGNMEVDLFDSRSRLVIELDGGQHLANADAYRRDRRKDALLQEHAYFVLRFLVEDVGKRLDHVLDAILRAVDPRSRTDG